MSRAPELRIHSFNRIDIDHLQEMGAVVLPKVPELNRSISVNNFYFPFDRFVGLEVTGKEGDRLNIQRTDHVPLTMDIYHMDKKTRAISWAPILGEPVEELEFYRDRYSLSWLLQQDVEVKSTLGLETFANLVGNKTREAQLIAMGLASKDESGKIRILGGR